MTLDFRQYMAGYTTVQSNQITDTKLLLQENLD